MKILLFIIPLVFLFGNRGFAQWSEEELAPYRQKAEKIAEEYITAQIESGKWRLEYDSLEMAFVADTLRVETIGYMLETTQYTTLAMHFNLRFMLDEYDKLLNKYYQCLLKILTPEDRIKFRNAQRLWLKYRDSEAKINTEIVGHGPYTGGGSIWPVIAGKRDLHLLKERVAGIYDLIRCVHCQL